MEPEPFAQGATRWAFRGLIARDSYKGFTRGTHVVVKAVKARAFNEGVRISKDDILAQELTNNMCEMFNAKNFVNKKVYTRPAQLIKAKRTHYDRRGVPLIAIGESMLLEQEIRGEYEKFNSNSGWANDAATLPQFFSHWSWVESGGRVLICDLQGHRGRPGGPKWHRTHAYYIFTDPVVLTKDPGQLGCGDLGWDGILQWFEGHECNDLCRRHGIASNKPEAGGQMSRRRKTPGTTFVPRRVGEAG